LSPRRVGRDAKGAQVLPHPMDDLELAHQLGRAEGDEGGDDRLTRGARRGEGEEGRQPGSGGEVEVGV
jgi:hypothetical protein